MSQLSKSSQVTSGGGSKNVTHSPTETLWDCSGLLLMEGENKEETIMDYGEELWMYQDNMNSGM